MKKIFSIAAALIFSFSLYFSCSERTNVGPETGIDMATPYSMPDIPYFPKNLNVPEDNPMTEEGVLLGKYLFYDGRLSGNSDSDKLMSCASCHIQKYGFEVGIDHPVFTEGQTFGLTGKPTPNYPMPLVNLVYNHNGYLWNGFVNETNGMLGAAALGVEDEEVFHFKNIESLVWMSITAPHEMNSTVASAVESIESIPMYAPMFKKAFGTEEITYDRISKAIGQFVRSIVSYRSKFHQWIRHEAELTDAELRGHNLFFSEDADCFHCHGGSVLMTTNQYYNNAKDNFFNDKSDRFTITGDPMDIGAYRAPSLINVALRAPYMHDGRFKSLEEVIDFYSSGLVYSDFVHPLMKGVRDRGVQLSDDEKADLTAFLHSLTDYDLISDPVYSCPPELIEWSGQPQSP